MYAEKMYGFFQEFAKLYGSCSMMFLKLSKGQIPTDEEEKKFRSNLDRIAAIHREMGELQKIMRERVKK